MNPSIEQLLQAVEDAPAPEVVILPNNSNIILAAQQAQALASKRVRVVPSKTVPQGVSALLAYSYTASLDENARSMERALGEVRTAEVTTAVRDVSLNGLEVREGQTIGLIDGELQIAGEELDGVVAEVVRLLCEEDIELLTFYYGDVIDEATTQDMVDRLSETYPDVEIEVLDGGQPHYHYIISAE
jgi:dihydroxyacetone kinase-like predicted kinase